MRTLGEPAGRRVALVLLAGGALLGGGCGSSTTTASAPTTTTTTTTAAPAPGTASLPPVQVGGAKFCQQLVEASQKLTTSVPSLAGSPSGEKALVASLVQTYRTLVAEAPADIKPAIADLAGTITALADAGTNPVAAEQRLQALETKAGPDAEAIGTWTGMHCIPG